MNRVGRYRDDKLNNERRAAQNRDTTSGQGRVVEESFHYCRFQGMVWFWAESSRRYDRVLIRINVTAEHPTAHGRRTSYHDARQPGKEGDQLG